MQKAGLELDKDTQDLDNVAGGERSRQQIAAMAGLLGLNYIVNGVVIRGAKGNNLNVEEGCK